MTEENIKSFFETLAKILSRKNNVEIKVKSIKKKSDE